MNRSGLGSTYLRGQIYWIKYSHRGRMFRESSGSTEEAQAKKLLKHRTKQMGRERGFIGPSEEKVSFEALVEVVEKDYAINGRRSADKLKCRIAHLRAAFAFDRAVDIKADRIRTYIANRQQEGARAATINRELAVLKRGFSLAAEDQSISQAPHIELLKERNVRQGFVDHAEFRSLMGQLPDHLRDPINFLYLTGWRVSEMRLLEWRDVDLAGQVVRLRPENSKNEDSREVPFSLEPELGEIFTRARESRRLNCRFVFRRDGHPLRDFRGSWAAACTKAGLGKILVHDLRRTAVRNLVRAGVPQSVAMEITGHKTGAVFRRYDIVSKDDKDSAMQKLSAYLEQQPVAPTIIPLTGSQKPD
jgi:integrase